MSWVRDAIRSLGMHIGIEGLDFNHRGVCMLREEQDTAMVIEDRGETVLVYVSRPAPYISEDTMEKVLRKTHYRSSRAVPLGACLAGENQLTFFTHLDRSMVTFQKLIETLGMLRNLLNTIEERR